ISIVCDSKMFKGQESLISKLLPETVVVYKNISKLNRKIAPYSFSIRASECLDLPGLTFEKRTAPLEGEQKRLYREMEKDCLAWLEESKSGEGEKLTAQIILSKYLRLQQITGGFFPTDEGKVHPIPKGAKEKILEDVFEEIAGDPCVIVCRFRPEMDTVGLVANRLGRKVVEIHGDVSSANRDEAKRAYQAGEADTFVMQIQVGRFGLTLTRGRHIIYYSCSWSLEDREQSIKRIHRKGQEQKCVVWDLVCEHTIDELVAEACARKLNVSDLALGWRPGR
ncbi:MAG TPA: DEAD/DEAH box helicase, partial [Acidobacteriota bacterium]|nr:DEAD/DEAH box helicase [Acidobacteriota bacterium]